VDTKQKRLGIGVIIRDSKGFVIAAMSRMVNSLQDPEIAEAIGALRAVELSKDIRV
jgi:hypothetical protein